MLFQIQKGKTSISKLTAFQIENKTFLGNTKKKIINAFLQKPISIHDLVKEVDTQLHSYEMQKSYPSQKI